MFLGIIIGVVDSHHGGNGIGGYLPALVLDLEGSRHNDLLCTRQQMPARRTFRIIGRGGGIQERTRGIHHQFHPQIAPANGTGIAMLP